MNFKTIKLIFLPFNVIFCYSTVDQQLMNDSNFKSWDGTVNGEMLDNGTYIYQMKFVDKKGRFHFKNGSVYLLR